LHYTPDQEMVTRLKSPLSGNPWSPTNQRWLSLNPFLNIWSPDTYDMFA
jgi:hypothetical protein